jgi:NitT/TauT family transport system substrate-binding protein
MKKTIAFVLGCIFALSVLGAEDIPATVRVSAIMGPSGLGMAKMIGNPPNLGAGIATSLTVEGSADVLLPKLFNGDADIGILPPNVAAKLYNVKPNSVIAGAIVGNGMLTLVTRDPSIKSISDLAGKTVTVAGQGSTPEYVFRTLISKAGLPADSVTLDFSIPNPEIAAALIAGKIQYALVPEPFATVAVVNGATGDSPVRRAISLRDEWKKAGFGDDFPMTLCVVRKEFAAKYPGTVRKFLDAYRDAIAWTVANPAEAGRAAEAAGLGLKAPIASKAIPSCNFTFIPAADGKESIEKLLSTFLAYAPEAVGGKLPDQAFYFK